MMEAHKFQQLQSLDSVQVLTEQLNEAKLQNEEQSKLLARKVEEAQKAAKDRTNDADGLYIKYLEAQQELKEKDKILEKVEIEYNQMRDAQEAYRDQIDLLQNEIDDMKSGAKPAKPESKDEES